MFYQGKQVLVKGGNGFDGRSFVLSVTGYHETELIFNADRPRSIPNRRDETSKAKRRLNFRPEISFEAGIQATVSWYQKESSRVLAI